MEYLSDKLKKKLDRLVGNSSSVGDRFSLIQSSLISTLLYHMSMYILPRTNLENLSKIIRKFFELGADDKKKYYMVRWDLVSKLNRKGGMGIKI
jgi:hypothetical protein